MRLKCSAVPQVHLDTPEHGFFSTLERISLYSTMKVSDGHYAGFLAMPKTFQMAQGGDSRTSIRSSANIRSLGGIVNGHLQFTTKDQDDENQFDCLVDQDHATLEFVGIPLAPWKLLRLSRSCPVTVATDWPSDEPKSSLPKVSALQARLKAMADEDQAARKAHPSPIHKSGNGRQALS